MKPKDMLPQSLVLQPAATEVRRRRRSPSASASLGALGALGALGVLLLLSSCAGELEGDPTRFTNAFGTPGAATGSGGTTTGSGGMSAGGAAPGSGGTTAPGSGGVGASGAPTIPQDDPCVANVLMKHACSTGCHEKQATADLIGAGLSLVGPNLGDRLSKARATYKGVTKNADKCVPNALIIDAANSANSVLLKKITNTQACGDPMPIGSTGLTGEDLSCIQGWIAKFK